MNVSEAIRARRSIRKYESDAVIPDEHIHAILEAAMMAPSAANTRPWGFVVVKNLDLREKMAKILRFGQMLPKASLAIVVYARPDLVSESLRGFWPQDCGAAIQNMLLEATGLGYGSVWCGIYPMESRTEKMRDLLDITGVPVAAVAFGKAAENPEARGFYDPERVAYID